MKQGKLLYWSLVVSMAGFLFGFDTIVISGAEQSLQEMWSNYALFGNADAFHGYIVVGSALFGTIFGALFGGFPTNKLGRKHTLLIIGVLYTISALGSALVSNPWLFALFRFIGGLGVGASTIAAPAYISEIAPAKQRGQLVAMYQFNIVFGILIAFVSNYLISQAVANHSWRWMIGIEALPAIIYTVMMSSLPKSPRWLMTHQHEVEQAKSILSEIYASNEVEQIVHQIEEAEQQEQPNESIWDPKFKKVVWLAIAIAAFNQFSGINAFLYYSKRFFEEAGLAEQASLLGSIGIGVVNLIFTLLGMVLIDRAGRKQLMIIGSIGYIFSLGYVAYCFFAGVSGIAVPIALFVFIASHAIGQGAVIWVFISEIFPNNVRSYGQSIGTSTHWILAFLIPASVPMMIDAFGPGKIFAFFALMMVLQLIWVLAVMPETKGKSLEELEAELLNQ